MTHVLLFLVGFAFGYYVVYPALNKIKRWLDR